MRAQNLSGNGWRFPAVKCANLPIILQWVILQNPDISGRMYQTSAFPIRHRRVLPARSSNRTATRSSSISLHFVEGTPGTDGQRLPALGVPDLRHSVHTLAYDFSDARRLRLLVMRPCGNTAHSVVPVCRGAGLDRISNVPPSCLSLALMAGMPTPDDIAPLPRFV